MNDLAVIQQPAIALTRELRQGRNLRWAWEAWCVHARSEKCVGILQGEEHLAHFGLLVTVMTTLLGLHIFLNTFCFTLTPIPALGPGPGEISIPYFKIVDLSPPVVYLHPSACVVACRRFVVLDASISSPPLSFINTYILHQHCFDSNE